MYLSPQSSNLHPPLPPNSPLKSLSYISQRNIDVIRGSHFNLQLLFHKLSCVYTRVSWYTQSPHTLVSQNRVLFPASSSIWLDLCFCRMVIEATCVDLLLTATNFCPSHIHELCLSQRKDTGLILSPEDAVMLLWAKIFKKITLNTYFSQHFWHMARKN